MDTGILIQKQYGGDVSAFVRDMNDKAREARKIESAKRRREYQRWTQMMRRCYDKKHHAYPTYGGRGICVCQQWHEFEFFYRDVGPPPGDGLSIDRIDNDGPYAPDNIRWATAAQQNANKPSPLPKISIVKNGSMWTARIVVNRCKTFATRKAAQNWLGYLEEKICSPAGSN